MMACRDTCRLSRKPCGTDVAQWIFERASEMGRGRASKVLETLRRCHVVRCERAESESAAEAMADKLWLC